MSSLFIALTILALLMTLVGVVGSVLPALPGPPFSWAALVLVYYTCSPHVSLSLVVIMGILTLSCSILDYFAPILVTKWGGGSRLSVIGSSVGVVAGLFFMPLGLVLGPLVGAFLGEMLATQQSHIAFRVAILSFVAFLVTAGIKLILSLLMTYFILISVLAVIIPS